MQPCWKYVHFSNPQSFRIFKRQNTAIVLWQTQRSRRADNKWFFMRFHLLTTKHLNRFQQLNVSVHVQRCVSTCALWPLQSGICPHMVYTLSQSCQSHTHDQLILRTQTVQPVCLGKADKTQRSHSDAKSWTSTSQTKTIPWATHRCSTAKCSHGKKTKNKFRI